MGVAAVLPAGQWGTALAIPLAANGHRVRLWFRDPIEAAAFHQSRINRRRLPEVRLPEGVTGTADLEAAVSGADLILMASSSAGLRAVCRQLKPHLPPNAVLLSLVKGLEAGTLLRMSEVIAEELPEAAGRIAVLSGPNFAVEVAQQLPAGTVAAAADLRVAELVQEWLLTSRFRVYTHDDVVGVELGGALKNVMAIGVGICEGLGMGHNAQAALITRGLTEMARLGAAAGASQLTFAGLSGIGDLVLTCTGDLSRNRQAGLAIGRGRSPAEVARTGRTIEGISTTRGAWQLAGKLSVAMPITEQLHAVLFDHLPPRVALERLMTRERTRE